MLSSTADLPLAAELAAVFGRAHGLLLTEDSVRTALSLVTALAHDTVGPTTVGAGVTQLGADGARTSWGDTDDVVSRAEALQDELGEGPGLEACARRTLVAVHDTEAESRWPRWCAAATGLGLRSALSAPLVAGDAVVGAITVFGNHPDAYDDRSQRLLSMFAGQAAVLLANVRTVQDARRLSDDLRRTLRSRDVISMAKGALMVAEQVGEEAAFALLVALAEREHRGVHDVAASVLAGAVRGPAVVRARPGDRHGERPSDRPSDRSGDRRG